MKIDKAREYFSDYYEGTLDNGLIQAFEHCLSESHSVRQEYDAFVSTMKTLDNFKFESIEAPSFLSDRIATRIEQSSKQKRNHGFSLRGWTFGFGVAGLACVALISTWINLGRRGTVETAGLGSVSAESANVSVTLEKGIASVHYNAIGQHHISVALASGTAIKSVDVVDKKVDLPLENPNAATVVFRVDISDEKHPIFVAVPGSARTSARSGHGTILEFASAAAAAYRIPVVVESANIAKSFDWKLSGAAVDSISASVRPLGLMCDQGKDDLLRISDR